MAHYLCIALKSPFLFMNLIYNYVLMINDEFLLELLVIYEPIYTL